MSTRLMITVVLVIAFTTSCGQVTATAPPTIIPTATRIPPTIAPTIIPTITPTVTPTATPIPTFNAQVIDREGAQTSVTNLEAYIRSDCGFGLIYVGVPTSTEFYWNFISINTGEYIVDIPFEIIKKITVEQGEVLNEQTVSVTLSDDTVLQGGDDPFGNGTDTTPTTMFIGESELGAYNIDFWSVSEITPLQEPNLSFTATAAGTKQAILELSDGTQLNLEHAVFYNWEFNNNGCYLGDERYDSSVGFETTGGSTFQVLWDNFKSIVFTRREYHFDEFKLVTLSGDEQLGRANNMSGVEGIANFGSFTLKVRVPFYSNAISLTFGN